MEHNQDYWSRARSEFELWKEIFALVDPVVTEFAESHEMTCEQWRHDTPSRILRWVEASDIHKNIELFLEGMPESFELTISGGASKDDPNTGRRKWTYETFSRLPVPVDKAELRRALDVVYQVVSAWKETDLRRTAK